jgi:C4-dicarboxylate-specific signal transduction histidine kinase
MRSEKLAGLGQMAGGVAHELNNPLTAVLGFAELIEEATTDKDTREGALAIHSEAKRMKRIVESLVRFWRPETQSAQLVSVAHILQDIEHMRGPELAHRGIRLEMDVADDLPKLAGNADQLKQMLLQLLSNAVHAVERSQESGVEHRVYIEAAMNGNRFAHSGVRHGAGIC